MFFLASKILWYLLNPFNIILLLFISGWILLSRKPKIGKALLTSALILIFLCGLSPIPTVLIRTLENRILARPVPNRIDGIIILAGGVDMKLSRRGLIELRAEADRIVEGVILAKRHPEAKVVITGGTGFLGQSDALREADGLAKLARSLGIPSERIIIERNSRNTHEHAVEMAKLLKGKKNEKWLLITSAAHMPRSVGCFRKVGLSPIPYPVDYKTEVAVYDALSMSMFVPTLGNIGCFSQSLHEWIGLIVYRLMGYTNSLFPKGDPLAKMEESGKTEGQTT